jgi:poly(hydroxyalkanoate) depolymerase family esterase
MRAHLPAALGLVAAACASDPVDTVDNIREAVTLTPVTGFGSNPGNLLMFTYAPPGLAPGAPLVVALHGCTQGASVYATQTEWHVLADRFGFAVLFPEQQSANNASRCFNWFEPGDTSRGQGEALSIAQMVGRARSTHGSDPARTFVTGMSAGGLMAEAMMATYPDLFAGGAVNAGGPFRCATSLTNASACQQGNVNRTPRQWGDLVRGAFPGYAGRYPRLVAFHGTGDFLVAPANLQESVDQWSDVLGIDATPDVNETFRTATHRVYRDASGAAMIETYLVSGMGHALTVDPGTAPDQGGATGAFSEDHDIYSSFYAARFWGIDAAGGPSPDAGPGDSPPTVNITAPASGATVSGTISVSATASDDVGVTRVEFRVDGAAFASDATAPYAVSLDTRTLSSGPHTLSAVAFDAAGNAGTSAAVAVTVNNPGGGALTETFSAASGPDNPGWNLGGWTLDATRDATGSPGSRSLAGAAVPQFNTVTRTASWSGLALGSAPRLRYSRQLSLRGANILASASFRVIVNDGADHVVDSQTVGFGSFTEAVWTARPAIDLSAFAGRTVSLKLVVSATDPASTTSQARAWVDQIEIR